MAVDVLFEVGHATVADLDGVSVKDLMLLGEFRVKTSPHLLVPADKTSNFYKMDSNTYNSLLQKNITKTYKKVQPNTMNSIELEAQEIARKLNLEDRVNTTAKREAFITLKITNPTLLTTQLAAS